MAIDKADPPTTPPAPPAHLNDLNRIDEQLAPLKALNLARPQSGWIRTIRTALRMTQAELAAILQINQKSLHALVPRDTLHNHYRNCARHIIDSQLADVENTMELENQAMKFSEEYLEKQVDELINGDFVHWIRF